MGRGFRQLILKKTVSQKNVNLCCIRKSTRHHAANCSLRSTIILMQNDVTVHYHLLPSKRWLIKIFANKKEYKTLVRTTHLNKTNTTSSALY